MSFREDQIGRSHVCDRFQGAEARGRARLAADLGLCDASDAYGARLRAELDEALDALRALGDRPAKGGE
jgi:hypothetical protein